MTAPSFCFSHTKRPCSSPFLWFNTGAVGLTQDWILRQCSSSDQNDLCVLLRPLHDTQFFKKHLFCYVCMIIFLSLSLNVYIHLYFSVFSFSVFKQTSAVLCFSLLSVIRQRILTWTQTYIHGNRFFLMLEKKLRKQR